MTHLANFSCTFRNTQPRHSRAHQFLTLNEVTPPFSFQMIDYLSLYVQHESPSLMTNADMFCMFSQSSPRQLYHFSKRMLPFAIYFEFVKWHSFKIHEKKNQQTIATRVSRLITTPEDLGSSSFA